MRRLVIDHQDVWVEVWEAEVKVEAESGKLLQLIRWSPVEHL